MMLTTLKRNNIFVVTFYFFTSFISILSTCYASPNKKLSDNFMTKEITSTTQFSDFERLVATKMAMDIRYFCAEELPYHSSSSKQCLKPVTQLPQALADMITLTNIGSVVLFAENLQTTTQIVQLTHDLQQAASKSQSGKPLIISIDQEGGRVVRLPHATSFAGNMAIGATYKDHGIRFASKTSTVIAKELFALGINNNYAPVVDVNTNTENPVINTRSFGEDPKLVAELGVAAVNGFQAQGVMATLKHFPGHGDTHVDSHLGLPLVAHDLATIKKQDLAPFQWAIKHSAPAMIMTAHIQYPALDNSTVLNKHGESIVRPATMSRKILTDLLRKKMGFEGIIATDALDMAGIAHYFDGVDAVVETFVAGADLAVMPFKIRQVEDIENFYQFIKDVAQQLAHLTQNNETLSTEITSSIARINRYRELYCQLPTAPIVKRINLAKQLIAQSAHLSLEQTLADNAVVQLTTEKNILPVNVTNINRIHLFVLDWQEFGALKQAIINQWLSLGKTPPAVSATVVMDGNSQSQLQKGEKLIKADLIIATVDTKIASAVTSVVDTGGAEDLLVQMNALTQDQTKINYQLLLRYQLQQAQNKNVPSVLIVKGSPYLVSPYIDLADAVLVTFDDHIVQQNNEQHQYSYSSGYNTSMAIISGQQKALGKLSVSLN